MDGTRSDESLGHSLTPTQDLDADGVDDVFIGSPYASTNGLSYNGFIRAVSGAAGNTIWQVDGTQNLEELGYSLTPAQDLDADGVGDVFIGSPDASTNGLSYNGFIRAVSGAAGNTIWQMDGTRSDESLGDSLTPTQDLDADGVDDVLIGSPWASTNGLSYNGFIRAVSGKIQPGMTSNSDMLSIGQGGQIKFNLDYPDSAAFYYYSFLMSQTSGGVNIHGLDVPLGYDLWLVRSYTGIYPGGLINPTGFLNQNGDGQVKIQLPANAIPPSMVGSTFYFATIVKLAWGDWEYSSVAVPLLLTP
jgi:hypothetical protein